MQETRSTTRLLFKKKITDIGWRLKEKEINKKWFQQKMDFFNFFGRDIETLLAKVKIAHGRRVFCLTTETKMLINLDDLNNGYNNFIDYKKNNKHFMNSHILSYMYC